MKEIQLTKGLSVKVDDEDYEWLIKFKWYCNNRGYAVRSSHFKTESGKWTCKTVLMHREIANAPKGMDVDHADLDPLNNQRYNLRVCTRTENSLNRGLCKANTSGFRGVNKADKKWIARIAFNGKRLYLGAFTDKQEAVRAYNAAALKYHGEFARLNPV